MPYTCIQSSLFFCMYRYGGSYGYTFHLGVSMLKRKDQVCAV